MMGILPIIIGRRADTFMQLPVLGDAVPRRGNAFSSGLGRALLRVLGWRIEGEFPNVPKAVIVAAPHTSNWDGAITLGTVLAMRLGLNWMGKDSMFRWPFGRLLRWMGGISVDRSATKGMVQATIDAFNNHQQMLMVISPEGTRSATGDWKMGFYHIASGAGVPILLAYVDFSHKVLGFGPLVRPSGDAEGDIRLIRAYYDNKVPRHAHRFHKSKSGTGTED